jgi:esterase
MTVALASREYGSSGIPLIILHGLFGSGMNWRHVAKQLEDAVHVWTLDVRNHGNSPHAEQMGYAQMAEDVLAFMDRQNLKQAALLGHSLGGKIAMWCALRWPQRVERLIVGDIAPVPYDHSFQDLVTVMRQLDLPSLKNRNDAEARLEPHISSVSLRKFLLQNLIATTTGFQWRVNLSAIDQEMTKLMGFPVEEELTSYSGKVLFIGGGNSDYIRRFHYRTIFQLFPKTQMVMLKGAGHWLHADQPESFIQTVRTFLSV